MRLRWIVALLFCGLFVAASESRAQDGSFVSAGRQLYYTTAGAGAPVVILSGGPGFKVSYMRPVADFFPNRQSILFEQRGTGRSREGAPTAEEMTLAVAVADLEALRQHLKQPRLALAGHSWGGMLAMAYAAAHPDRVDWMVLIDTGGPTWEFQSWFGDNIRARMRPEDVEAERYWTEAAKHGVPAEKAVQESVRAMTPAYFFDRAKGLAFAAQIADGDLHADSSELMFADLAEHYDVRAGLRTFERPVLIVHGHQDPMGDKVAEDVHALIENSSLVYLNQCGHFPWLEQPEAFRVAVTGFLATAATAAAR